MKQFFAAFFLIATALAYPLDEIKSEVPLVIADYSQVAKSEEAIKPEAVKEEQPLSDARIGTPLKSSDESSEELFSGEKKTVEKIVEPMPEKIENKSQESSEESSEEKKTEPEPIVPLPIETKPLQEEPKKEEPIKVEEKIVEPLADPVEKPSEVSFSEEKINIVEVANKPAAIADESQLVPKSALPAPVVIKPAEKVEDKPIVPEVVKEEIPAADPVPLPTPVEEKPEELPAVEATPEEKPIEEKKEPPVESSEEKLPEPQEKKAKAGEITEDRVVRETEVKEEKKEEEKPVVVEEKPLEKLPELKSEPEPVPVQPIPEVKKEELAESSEEKSQESASS